MGLPVSCRRRARPHTDGRTNEPAGRELQATMSPTTKGIEACVCVMSRRCSVRAHAHRGGPERSASANAFCFTRPWVNGTTRHGHVSRRLLGLAWLGFAHPDREVEEGGVRGAEGEGRLK